MGRLRWIARRVDTREAMRAPSMPLREQQTMCAPPPTSHVGRWWVASAPGRVVEVGDRNTYYDRERQRRRTDWEEPIIISSLARPSGELICASPQCRATDAGCGTWPIDRPTIWLLPISTIGRQPLYCVTYFTSAPILFEPIRRPAAPGRRAKIFCVAS